MRPRRRSQVRSRGRTSSLAAAGFVGGVIAGLAVWSMQMSRYRRDLFSRSPIKRLAALGYLGGHPGVETARLLNEYVRWETRPLLRKRAQKLLDRVQDGLV